MKHLTITYDNHTLFDADIDELVWVDNDSGVKVEGRLKKTAAPTSGLGAGLLDMLTQASKAKTQQLADEKRQEPTSE